MVHVRSSYDDDDEDEMHLFRRLSGTALLSRSSDTGSRQCLLASTYTYYLLMMRPYLDFVLCPCRTAMAKFANV